MGQRTRSGAGDLWRLFLNRRDVMHGTMRAVTHGVTVCLLYAACRDSYMFVCSLSECGILKTCVLPQAFQVLTM